MINFKFFTTFKLKRSGELAIFEWKNSKINSFKLKSSEYETFQLNSSKLDSFK